MNMRAGGGRCNVLYNFYRIAFKRMEDLSTMVDDLSKASERVVLKINMEKTKIVFSAHVPTAAFREDSTLEVVDYMRLSAPKRSWCRSLGRLMSNSGRFLAKIMMMIRI